MHKKMLGMIKNDQSLLLNCNISGLFRISVSQVFISISECFYYFTRICQPQKSTINLIVNLSFFLNYCFACEKSENGEKCLSFPKPG